MQITKEVIPLAAKVRPQQLGLEDEAVSGWVDVSQFESVMTLAQAGDLDGGAVTLSFEQATTDDAPEGAELKALSSWTGGTLSADGATIVVDNSPSKLDLDNGFRYVRASLASDDQASAGPTAGAAMFGANPRHTDAVAAVGDDTPGAGPQE